MIIKKVTEKYHLYQEGETYYLNLGVIRKGEDTTTRLNITDIDTKNFSVNTTCGCTSSNLTVLNVGEVTVDLKYKDCDNKFTKTVKLKEKNKITLLKIIGQCHT